MQKSNNKNIKVIKEKINNIPVKRTDIKKEVFVKDIEGKEQSIGILNTTQIQVLTDRNFYKLWIPKYKEYYKESLIIVLLFHFIDKMQITNKLIINYIELAERYKTTRQTISNTIKKLIKMQFIKIKAGICFVNPLIIYKGSPSYREKVINNYIKNIFTD